MSLTTNQRRALITGGLGDRLILATRPEGCRLQASPEYEAAGATGVYLTWREEDGVPYVVKIQNGSEFAGWGYVLVDALRLGYPETKVWRAESINVGGISFWDKVRLTRGVAVVPSQAVTEADRRAAQACPKDQSRRPLAELDEKVARKRSQSCRYRGSSKWDGTQ